MNGVPDWLLIALVIVAIIALVIFIARAIR
jgi:hypothetical protein